MTTGGSNKLIDTLRLSDEQWQELSSKLDVEDPCVIGQRRYERITYRRLAQIAVAIQRPNGEWAMYAVRSRDLSPGGIGFIHGSYIHTGCACRVILKDSHDHAVCLEGSVKRCELINGNAHHVGVQFEKEIELTDYIKIDEEKPDT